MSADDWLIGDPQRVQRAIEACFEAEQVPSAQPARPHEGQRLAFEPRDASQADGARQHALELVEVERLREVNERAQLDRLHRALDVRGTSDEHHRHVGASRSDRAEQLDAGHLRHRNIGDDGVDRFFVQELQGLAAVARLQHFVAGQAQSLAEKCANVLVVVCHEHARFRKAGSRP
jgi:hypothetical protein